jgi:hypothetical protein
MKKTKNWFKPVILILILVVIALLIYQFFIKPDDTPNILEDSVKAELGQLDNKSEEEIQEELNRVVEENMFHIAINGYPVFEDGESEGTLEIENVPSNNYSMNVQITLQDTDELIYESGILKPNYHIQTDKLSKDLDKGEYPCNVTFTAYDTDSQQEVGSTGTQITIYVLN